VSQPFIDSNVVLYLLSADTAKANLAQHLFEAGGTISVQVLNEVTAVCQRKLKMPWQEIDAVLQALTAACDVVPLTLTTQQKAVDISKRYGLSIYDANIVACALISRSSMLLTEDMQDGQLIESLVICNPFKSEKL
jgi:predicted nucleic acid-binding protein